jgi:hypothetical protein
MIYRPRFRVTYDIVTPESAENGDTADHSPEVAPHFAAWLNALDRLIIAETGIGAYDWPDWCFADSFEQGDTPEEAFAAWCEDQGWPTGENEYEED